jgi:hypothetical protein
MSAGASLVSQELRSQEVYGCVHANVRRAHLRSSKVETTSTRGR